MNILITGANGYIGQRLVESLLDKGHTLLCCVRSKARFEMRHSHPCIKIVEIDFADPGQTVLPENLDIAYYLIHSLAASGDKFEAIESDCALNFNRLIAMTTTRQVIYLGGI